MHERHPYSAYLNLASAKLGAQTVACSDDFFADMSRLIQDAEPVFLVGKYDHNGKWMDGWESRRRRSAGFDWCVIRLAVPGVIVGFDLDTRHFTGNYPPGACIEGATGEVQPSDESTWISLLDEVGLEGNRQHFFDAQPTEQGIRWIRLKIYPDGGVARLRVYGTPVAPTVASGTELELSSLLHGSRVVAYSDAHYGNPEVILTLGRGETMGDGWETARRRVPGNEWIIVQLGVPGCITRIEVDTAHFKGNFPAACSLQAAQMPALGRDALVTQAMFWPEVLPQTALTADAIHPFACATQTEVTHVKLNTYPDGGISRLRIFGVSA
ncbi:MAG: allantoicase [Litorivicinaceae bacterium]|jgi:allantoicase|nr:allantoicase [Litorivicinaceae bacterium]MDP5329389.1 allantoicase [Litorivicinaceae bacterium]MDP5340265.1 allantoicase [Litorivicinaceae bacterium]MDP5342219.1 allantoicase [Litorivicinaceae bacterium]MDP5364482.1 allantoicase [Litorivicinaceae bacterium]